MQDIKKQLGDIKNIATRLHNGGFRSFIVGGACRDLAMHLPPKDFDIATSAKPYEVLRLFPKCKIIETGMKHGTVTVIYNGTPYEITSLRIDGKYSDSRHPDAVEFTDDIEKDLSRRDFTINAIAYDIITKEKYDPFDGDKDINLGVIRAVGDADERFNEDPLRMMRAVRFASTYGLVIESKTFYSIKKNAHLIERVSKERIRDEILKILESEKPSIGIRLLEKLDLLFYVINPLYQCLDISQVNIWHIYDVYNHIIASLDGYHGKDTGIKLALLLHDVGKPNTKSVGDDGEDHFYGHGEESARIASEWMNEYKFDKTTIDRISTLVEYHDYFIDAGKPAVKKLLNKIGYQNAIDLLKIRRADISAQSDYMLVDRRAKIAHVYGMIERIKECEEAFTLKQLDINGKVLIGLGMEQGKKIGNMLQLLLSKAIEDPSINTRDELIKIALEYKDKINE